MDKINELSSKLLLYSIIDVAYVSICEQVKDIPELEQRSDVSLGVQMFLKELIAFLRSSEMTNQQFILTLKKWSQTKDLSLANDICTYLVKLYKIENIKHNEIITHEQKMEMQRGEVEE